MKYLFILLPSLFALPAFAETSPELDTAIFAGGCFWCMEPPFDKLHGIVSTTSGYTSGHKQNPSYEEVSSGATGHAEAIQIVFNAKEISYTQLLDVFWKNIDPYALNRQFCDSGNQYRSGIYYRNAAQEKVARQSLKNLEKIKEVDNPVVTEIVAASKFYPAEDYHQNYYIKNPMRYKFYRYSCGRDKRLEELWGENESGK